MADWKSMYMLLVGGINDAIHICEDKTVNGVLVKALLDAEECYIATTEPVAPPESDCVQTKAV